MYTRPERLKGLPGRADQLEAVGMRRIGGRSTDARRALWPRPLRAGVAATVGVTILLASGVRADEPVDAGTPSAAAPSSTSAEALRRRPMTGRMGSIGDRIALLTKALDLSADQQRELRAVLERQAAAVRRVWSDPSLTEGERPPITAAITDRTADEIRDLLTPAQRQKYNPPKPPKPPAAAGSEPDVSKWLNALRPKS
jgi:hypothetical protein